MKEAFLFNFHCSPTFNKGLFIEESEYVQHSHSEMLEKFYSARAFRGKTQSDIKVGSTVECLEITHRGYYEIMPQNYR